MKSKVQAMAEPLQEPVKTEPAKWRSMAFLFLAGLLMVLILAASWAPDSRMAALRWVPDCIARLADRDPNLRTAVPFIPLAFLLVRGCARSNLKWPLAWAVGVSAVCLGLSEFGQVFLPLRTADAKDLLWGGVGIAVGTVLAWVLKR